MLNSVFITVGYPSPQRPELCVFIHRTVKELSLFIGVHVIQLRAWRLGLPLIERREWDGIPVLSLSIPQIPYRGAKRLNTLLLTEFGRRPARSIIQKADIIHTSGLFPTGYIGSRWSRLYQKPHVSQAMGTDVNIELPASNISGRNKNWLLELDGVACNSEAMSSKLSEMMPGISNVKVIHRGVDTDTFSPEGLIDGHQVGLSPVRYLFLGGFQTWNANRYNLDNSKGGHLLLEAWRKVEMAVGNSSLLLGGPGSNIVRLHPWLSTLQRPEAVIIMPAVSPGRVPKLLRGCDVVILPSLNEGLPNLANEAQASARPVLGSSAGGIPETVLHGKTGWIVQKGDMDQLAEGIIWFYKHQDQIAEMGNRARQHMIKDFSWEQNSQEMITLFQTAIEHYKATKGSARPSACETIQTKGERNT